VQKNLKDEWFLFESSAIISFRKHMFGQTLNSTIFNKLSPQKIKAIWWCFFVWLGSRLFLALWGAILWMLRLGSLEGIPKFYHSIKPIETGFFAPILGIWLRWDVVNYLRIAQNGYYENDLTAFFPLFPLLGKILGNFLGGNDLLALMIISNFATLAAVIILYNIVEKKFSVDTARKTIILLLVSPGSFFFYAAYPQSLLLLSVLIIFIMIQQNKWLFCFIVGIISGLIHPIASSISVLISVYTIPKFLKNRSWKNLHLLLAPLTPLMGIGLFLSWRIMKGFPDYSMLQTDLFGKHMIPPWEIITLAVNMPNLDNLPLWVNIAFFVLTLWLLPKIWVSISKEAAIFVFAVLLIISSVACNDEPLPSYLRYILPAYPIFICLALELRNQYKWFLLTFIFLLLFLSGAFIMWFWVA
jgi:hypothetical protein